MKDEELLRILAKGIFQKLAEQPGATLDAYIEGFLAGYKQAVEDAGIDLEDKFLTDYINPKA